MGQQQLLLLVLSTVIVGLATVAGIQAFSENQEQATQDALTQRGLDIATQVSATLNKPSQFGGANTGDNPTDIAAAAGFNDVDGSGKGIPADGAGNNADCDITDGSGPVVIICASEGSGSDNSSASDIGQTVTVHANSENATITDINGTSTGNSL